MTKIDKVCICVSKKKSYDNVNIPSFWFYDSAKVASCGAKDGSQVTCSASSFGDRSCTAAWAQLDVGISRASPPVLGERPVSRNHCFAMLKEMEQRPPHVPWIDRGVLLGYSLSP